MEQSKKQDHNPGYQGNSLELLQGSSWENPMGHGEKRAESWVGAQG